MRKEHRPLFLLRLNAWFNQFYTRRFIAPQFDHIGCELQVLSPRSLQIFGINISAGDHLHLISSKYKPINLTTWSSKQDQGAIQIGNHCLISPGTHISSAVSIQIGDNCMLGAETYISDCDWHGVYNRTRPFRCSQPITLKPNVWLGYRTIICKGVTIGENSIIGAGSVVTKDVPDNVIAAGNPAAIIKSIDPKRKMLTREFLFSSKIDYSENKQELENYLFSKNTLFTWMKSTINPTTYD